MVAINALEVEYIKKLRIGRNFARTLPCPDPIPRPSSKSCPITFFLCSDIGNVLSLIFRTSPARPKFPRVGRRLEDDLEFLMLRISQLPTAAYLWRARVNSPEVGELGEPTVTCEASVQNGTFRCSRFSFFVMVNLHAQERHRGSRWP